MTIPNYSIFLFSVTEQFMITGRGLVLLPGVEYKKVKVGDPIKIIRPDKTSIETTIKGMSFTEVRHINIGNDLTAADVPVGSEVWLITKE